MKIHLKDKEIENLVAGIASIKDTHRAEEHMRECAGCRKEAELIKSVFSQREYEAEPGEHIIHAVLGEWDTLNRQQDRQSFFPVRLAWIFASGLAVACAIIFSFYLAVDLKKNPPAVGEFFLASIRGDVTINGTEVSAGQKLHDGNTIITKSGSAIILYDSTYSMVMEAMTELTVNATVGNEGAIFNLKRGRIISSSAGNLKYAFLCGRYCIIPTGTVFTLDFDGKRLFVKVSKGGVSIKNDDVQVDVLEGEQWESDGSNDKRNNGSRDSGNVDYTGDDGAGDKSGTGQSNNDKRDTDDKTVNKDDSKSDLRETKREIRDELDQMKKEQRKEREGRGRR